jgi:hypothetical protein
MNRFLLCFLKETIIYYLKPVRLKKLKHAIPT